PDVLLPGARYAGAVARGLPGDGLARTRPCVHRHARLGRHAGGRRLRGAGDGHGAPDPDLRLAATPARLVARAGPQSAAASVPWPARPALAGTALASSGRPGWRPRGR